MSDVTRRPASRASPPPVPVAEAVLSSGGAETRYLRAGVGSPVVLLAEPSESGPAGGQLFEALARSFRVIRPELPPRAARDFTSGTGAPIPATPVWLRGVIDGLGLGRCALVAEGALCLSAIWFALIDPFRVGQLVLLVPEAPDPLLPGDEVTDVLERTGQRMMLLRTGADAAPCRFNETIVSRVVSFLQDPASDR